MAKDAKTQKGCRTCGPERRLSRVTVRPFARTSKRSKGQDVQPHQRPFQEITGVGTSKVFSVEPGVPRKLAEKNRDLCMWLLSSGVKSSELIQDAQRSEKIISAEILPAWTKKGQREYKMRLLDPPKFHGGEHFGKTPPLQPCYLSLKREEGKSWGAVCTEERGKSSRGFSPGLETESREAKHLPSSIFKNYFY